MASSSLPRATLVALGVLLGLCCAWLALAPDDETSAENWRDDPAAHRPPATPAGENRPDPVMPSRGAASRERQEHDWRELRVRVVRASDCAPLHGAEVFVVDGRGKVLGSRFSDRHGIVQDLPHRKRAHGVVAWHPDFQLKGCLVGDPKLELPLQEVRNLHLQIDDGNRLAVEWLTNCELTFQVFVACEGNPVRRRADFCEEAVLRHLGLERRDAQTGIAGVSVTRFIDRDLRVRLWTETLHGHRMWRTQRGAAIDTPRREKERDRRTPPRSATTVPRSADTVAVPPGCDGKHAAILHFARRADDEGEIWLELPGTTGIETATFEERSGVATFRVFGLRSRAYLPTIRFVSSDGKATRVVPCRSVGVRGRTEQTLKPLKGARLAVKLAGVKTSVTLEMPFTSHKAVVHGNSHTFDDLRPGKYRVFARQGSLDRKSDGECSPVAEVTLRDGATETVTLRLEPAWRVRVRMPPDAASLVIHHVRGLRQVVLQGKDFEEDPLLTHRERGTVLIAKPARALLRPGRYEFRTYIARREVTRVVTITGGDQVVDLR